MSTEPKAYPTKVKHVPAYHWNGSKEATEFLTAWITAHSPNTIVKTFYPGEGDRPYLLLRQPASATTYYHSYVMQDMWVTLSTRGHQAWFKAVTDRVFRAHHEVD